MWSINNIRDYEFHSYAELNYYLDSTYGLSYQDTDAYAEEFEARGQHDDGMSEGLKDWDRHPVFDCPYGLGYAVREELEQMFVAMEGCLPEFCIYIDEEGEL